MSNGEITGRNSDPREFDAFMAYHSSDGKDAEWLHNELTERSMKIWIDTEQVQVGDPLDELIMEGMKASENAIVLFGPTGLGEWQRHELRALRELHAKGKIARLMLVMLPGVTDPPELLAFAGCRHIQFSEDTDEEEVLDDLEWAITGQKPKPCPWPFEIHIPVDHSSNECFIASRQPKGAPRYDAIERAVKAAGMEVLHTRDAGQPGFSPNVSKGIRAAEIVVVDCSSTDNDGIPDPELMYELGLANALSKPTLVLTDTHDLRLPHVITVRRLMQCSEEDVFDGSFERELTEKIHGVIDELKYPFLTENDPDDIYAVPSRLVSTRMALQTRFCRILLFGIHLHSLYRELSKHAHKMKSDIERFVKDQLDLTQMENSELHSRNWHDFELAFAEGYAPAHHSAERLRKCWERPRQRDTERGVPRESEIEKSFQFLLSRVSTSQESSLNPLEQSLKNSHSYCKLAKQAVKAYGETHRMLIAAIPKTEIGRYERATNVRALCGELLTQVDLVNSYVNEMMTTLLEVIAMDQKIGGAENVFFAHNYDRETGVESDRDLNEEPGVSADSA